MAFYRTKKLLLTIILAQILVETNVIAQNCGCATNLCCSQHGYCGTGDAYCGAGCQEGPCYETPPSTCNCLLGLCCSQYGYCGTGDAYCGDGCQEGPCYNSTTPPSPTPPPPPPTTPSPPSACNCAVDLCCSQYGYCGTGDDYCGIGCQGGPCYPPPTPNNVSIADIVTQKFFDGILDQAGPSCPAKGFYSREAFLEATDSYPLFGRLGSEDDSKRELAAYFAHVTHETGHFCYIDEINGYLLNYCDANNAQWPCVPGKSYHGRGPLQLSWNYNYGPAGQDIGFDGLNYPETVATNPVVSFRTSCWFWVNRVQPYMDQGFGATIRAINGMECNGGNSATVQARVTYYLDYCSQLDVDPGSDLYC